MGNTLYDQDFYAWANEQARLLRAGDMTQADIEHIAEEIESIGKAEKRELVSRLDVLLMHLLKWRFQPTGRSTSWRLSIEEQRRKLARHLADNPSLKSRLTEAMADAYGDSILAAARETGLDRSLFPASCPWSFEQIISPYFWPDHPTP
jgi:Domain of unknown function DUF29